MYGHHGRILMADLNTGQIRTEHFFDEGFARKYLGGERNGRKDHPGYGVCHGCPVGCGKKVRLGKERSLGRSAKMPEYVAKSNCFTSVGDSLVICRFTAERGMGTPLNRALTDSVRYVTGWDLSLVELEIL